ncbi:uncharacterized protein LOC111102431 isoform X2 [Crassostrea virginica]
MMIILMLSVFLFAGTEVQSMYLRYTYDFLVEGDSLHVIVKNVTDLSQLSYSLSFQCPVNCTDKQTSLVTLQEEPLSGFRLKAGENSEKDPLFLILVNIRNKTAGNAPLETLRITFVDNDVEPSFGFYEGLHITQAVWIDHPRNQPETIYTMLDILDQDFKKHWLLEPFSEKFKANEGGKRMLKLTYIDDNAIVSPDRNHLMVIKRLSTCEGIQRYYRHFSVSITDNDVLGHWSEWGAWGDCSTVHPFCSRERKRTCLKSAFLLATAVCAGESSETEACKCPSG